MSGGLLLDTHVIVWTISDSDKISRAARRAMSRSTAVLFVSVVSAWEIVLKHQAGKLRLHASLEEIVDHVLYRSPWSILPVSAGHVPALTALPTRHKDPFDRLLIAQARHEGLTIVTADEQIKAYDIHTIW